MNCTTDLKKEHLQAVETKPDSQLDQEFSRTQTFLSFSYLNIYDILLKFILLID